MSLDIGMKIIMPKSLNAHYCKECIPQHLQIYKELQFLTINVWELILQTLKKIAPNLHDQNDSTKLRQKVCTFFKKKWQDFITSNSWKMKNYNIALAHNWFTSTLNREMSENNVSYFQCYQLLQDKFSQILTWQHWL